jgi:hypothetical protein
MQNASAIETVIGIGTVAEGVISPDQVGETETETAVLIAMTIGCAIEVPAVRGETMLHDEVVPVEMETDPVSGVLVVMTIGVGTEIGTEIGIGIVIGIGVEVMGFEHGAHVEVETLAVAAEVRAGETRAWTEFVVSAAMVIEATGCTDQKTRSVIGLHSNAHSNLTDTTHGEREREKHTDWHQ